MTDPLTVGVASLAAGVAGLIAWLSLPDPPDLDGERWFKLMLCELLAHEVEAAGGDAEAWTRRVLNEVPYNPVARFPDLRVVGSPPAYTHDPGERALIERLEGVVDLQRRWALVFDEDPLALSARLDGPEDLGPAYDPRTWLGTAGWEDLGAWNVECREALARKLDALWILVGDDEGPAVLAALAEELPRSKRVDPAGLKALLDGLESTVELRLVFVAVGEAAHGVLRALHLTRGLRDHTLAFVAIAAPLQDAAHRDWMEGNFRHLDLDLELERHLPCFSLQWLDRADPRGGAFGRLMREARFPEPRLDPLARESIQIVDLGALSHTIEARPVARALRAVVTTWVLAARA